MTTIAKHTSYLVINEKGQVEMISWAPDQNLTGQRGSDLLANSLGLFMETPSHDCELGEIACYRVVLYAQGLHTVRGLKYTIVAKRQFDWDMSKSIGQRQSNVVKSDCWDSFRSRL